MVCGGHVERRRPSPQGAGSVYWLDPGATASTAAPGGQQFAFVCPARVPLSQPGQSVHEADVGAFEFGLGKHLGSSGGTGRELCGPAAVSRHRLQSQWLEPVVGFTRGWKRSAVDFYEPHGHPKQVWVRELVKKACVKLRAAQLLPPWAEVLPKVPPRCSAKAGEITSLMECLGRDLPEFRRKQSLADRKSTRLNSSHLGI